MLTGWRSVIISYREHKIYANNKLGRHNFRGRMKVQRDSLRSFWLWPEFPYVYVLLHTWQGATPEIPRPRVQVVSWPYPLWSKVDLHWIRVSEDVLCSFLGYAKCTAWSFCWKREVCYPLYFSSVFLYSLLMSPTLCSYYNGDLHSWNLLSAPKLLLFTKRNIFWSSAKP